MDYKTKKKKIQEEETSTENPGAVKYWLKYTVVYRKSSNLFVKIFYFFYIVLILVLHKHKKRAHARNNL